MWNIGVALVFIIFLLMLIYLVLSFRKFKFIKKIKNKFLQIILCLLPLILIFILFNYVNSIVILFHLFIFVSLSHIFILIYKKISKKKVIEYSYALTGIIITIIYLAIGAYLDYHVFETRYEIKTDKNISNYKIIQISDSHVGTTFNGEGFLKHINRINKIKSDIVVITGDFVDDDTTKEDMIKSCEALGVLKPKYGVYFIYGNHDRGYFNYRNFSESDLVKELEKNNVKVLRDEVVLINDELYLIGRDDKTNTNRKSIEELTRNLDKTKYLVDLNHQPNDYDNEKNKVDLVLCGHTHGGQLFPLGYIGLLINANDAFYGLEKRGNTNFIVNSGLSDWAIDFKTGTKSEYGIIDIISE